MLPTPDVPTTDTATARDAAQIAPGLMPSPARRPSFGTFCRIIFEGTVQEAIGEHPAHT
jgi:hypothetical protein